MFLKAQAPGADVPFHSCSKTLASLVVLAALAAYTDASRTAIHLTTRLTWKDVKMQFRPGAVERTAYLNPVDSYYVMPFQVYPPVPKGIDERNRQAELWMGAKQF